MSRFASGKYAKLKCDRCDFIMNYKDAVKDWQGLWLHKIPCHEEKHPQLSPPKNVDDPRGLEHPRPDTVESTILNPPPDISTFLPLPPGTKDVSH